MPTPLASVVFDDFNTSGVPSSGNKKVKKREARAWGAWLESIITAFTSNGGLIYSSKAEMDADLAHDAKSMAWVLGDATVANNGIYKKNGASGAGSWTRVADLPFSFIIASDVGAGTSNAIQATTSIPVTESALVLMNVFEANTSSPVTVSLNGGAALNILSASGQQIKAGDLKSGMFVAGRVSGSNFRLINDFGLQFLTGTNTGGTNAITATTPFSIPSGDSQALIILPILSSNTASPVTVSFNGGTALTLKTNTGNDVAAGGLVPGMRLLGMISGSTFRLINDQVSAAIVAAAEAAQAAAEAAATSINIKNVEDRTALKSLDTSVTTLVFLREQGREGLFKWTAGNFSTLVAADTGEGVYIKASAISSSAGAWVREYDGFLQVEWFGAISGLSKSNTTANNTAFAAADALCYALGGGTIQALAQYYTLSKFRWSPGVYLEGSGHGKWMPSFPTQSKTWEGTNFVAASATKDYQVRGVTSMRYAGGWREDPDSAGRYFKLTSLMNADAAGTAAATPRDMQVFMANKELGKDKGGVRNCRIVPWIGADGKSDYGNTANTSLGDDVDVGLMVNTMEGGRFENLQIRGYWRVAGLAEICPDFSDYGRNENNVFVNVSAQGFVGIMVRSGDTWAVQSATSSTLTIRWSEESFWPSNGQFDALGVGYVTYTGISRSGSNLTFTGCSANVSGVSIIRAPFRGTGFSTGRFVGCEGWALYHHSSQGAESLGFPSPSKGTEVSGFPMRGIHWFDCSSFGEASNSCCVFLHDCQDFTFAGGKWEIGHAIASPIASSSTAAAPSGDTRNLSLLGLFWSSTTDTRLFTPRSLTDLQRQLNPASRLSGNLLIEALTGQDWQARMASGQTFQVLKSDGAVAVVTTDSGNTELRGSLTVGPTGAAGFINSQSGHGLTLREGTTSRLAIQASTGHWWPGADNAQNVGSGALRMATVFAGTGSINTSSEEEKQQIDAIREAVLDAWGDVEWSEFRFNDAVEAKGDSARVHFGLVAQRVVAAFEAHGLNPFDFGPICFDEWDDQYEPVYEKKFLLQPIVNEAGETVGHIEVVDMVPSGEERLVVKAGSRYGLRYSECLAIEAAYQRRRIARLEEAVKSLIAPN
ncbi:tail fiber domain-containing protein [Rhizobium azibense]|uniref:Endosialidase-like protein n=1 Tax=Rhizobium azibense TaxID=1136135 RepID=A0A4V2VDV7_9HYPH|nr:tail fiber domain-containing protein [Rhizobium azibense]TCU34175.1 endosialidase-like protein [Rhizobium azibense]